MSKDEWLELKTVYLNLARVTEKSQNELIKNQVKRLGLLVLDTMPDSVAK